MLAEWLTAVQELAPVAALRGSRWTYASVNAAHIVGIALLFGAIAPLDLRLMGWRRSVPLRELTRTLLPVAMGGFALAVAAGLLLFSTRAAEYAAKPLLFVKLTLIVCALLNILLLHRAVQWEAQQALVGVSPPLRLKIAGALSIGLWLSVIVCGRMLAFVD
jgi:hypothetical protein